MHLPKRGEDLAKWKALGNYEEKLLDVYKKYTDEWAKAFPRQEISLHVSKVLDLASAILRTGHRLWFEQISGRGSPSRIASSQDAAKTPA